MGPPEPLEIAHGDIEDGHGQLGTRYFNSLLFGELRIISNQEVFFEHHKFFVIDADKTNDLYGSDARIPFSGVP